MRVSEIYVKRIRVNQGLGVFVFSRIKRNYPLTFFLTNKILWQKSGHLFLWLTKRNCLLIHFSKFLFQKQKYDSKVKYKQFQLSRHSKEQKPISNLTKPNQTWPVLTIFAQTYMWAYWKPQIFQQIWCSRSIVAILANFWHFLKNIWLLKTYLSISPLGSMCTTWKPVTGGCRSGNFFL